MYNRLSYTQIGRETFFKSQVLEKLGKTETKKKYYVLLALMCKARILRHFFWIPSTDKKI